jgi:hypothetical protein
MAVAMAVAVGVLALEVAPAVAVSVDAADVVVGCLAVAVGLAVGVLIEVDVALGVAVAGDTTHGLLSRSACVVCPLLPYSSPTIQISPGFPLVASIATRKSESVLEASPGTISKAVPFQ